ncbi:hypothetical protein HJG54_20900 [Leptolyngbya sp. NK1-12]|uniref:Uncharacterized protein n=1 Tax=Leptolyngbya sp. NK1-12 TaxID=2547451 RepID=A0AA97AI09_9CYAN|nr:hypothetical protein [Leptolyngbya sp. NK1-12]WNZ25064.1 hypothetical protein HJG54_20900 [Leptolyngbya sp. NK1-12]
MNLDKQLATLVGLTGVTSISILLSLPALALLTQTVSARLGQTAPDASEQLFAQSDNGDGDGGGDNSSASDNGSDNGSDNDSDNDSSSSGRDSSDASSNDSDSGTSASDNSGSGDSGEVFGTRGQNRNEGGAPYIGVGASPLESESDGERASELDGNR